jgi:hypothetical protein
VPANPGVDLCGTGVDRQFRPVVHQTEAAAPSHQGTDLTEPIVHQDRVTRPAVREDDNGVGVLDHIVARHPTAVVGID